MSSCLPGKLRPDVAALAALVLLTTGCGGGSGKVSLARLASNQSAYLGKEVATTGVVELQRSGNGSAYYVLADAAQDLVLLVPRTTVRGYQGERVTVHGGFAFDPRQGRLIRVNAISRSSG